MMSLYGELVLLGCVFISRVAPKDYIIGSDASLKCNPQHATLMSILWDFNYETSVAKWKSTDSAPTYLGQWNGRTTLDTGNGDIEIRLLELLDTGIYRCIYDDKVPTPGPTKPGAILNVNILAAPTVDTVYPSGIEEGWVDRDMKSTLICRVDPVNPTDGNVYWRINGTKRPDTTQGCNDGTYCMKGTLITDFATYSAPVYLDCLVEHDKFGETTKPYTSVELRWKVSTKVEPESTGAAIEGHPYTLKCHLTDGNPKTVAGGNYEWKSSGGQPIRNQTRSTYTIQSLNRTEHSKTFTCAGKNSVGMGVQGTGYPINVLYSFDTVTVTISDPAVEGYSVTLECSWTGGNPQQKLKVEWEKDGEPFDRDDTEGDSTARLTLHNLVRDDDGEYVCMASNQAGPGISQPRTIEVMFKPEGASSLSISTGSRHNITVEESVDFTCSHPGDSNPDPNRFTFSEDNKIKQNDTSSQWQDVSYLNVRDRVEMSCAASNLYGVAGISNKIQVSVEAYATVEYPQQDQAQSPVYNDPNVYLDCLGAGNQRSVSWKKQGKTDSLVDWEVIEDRTESGNYSFGQKEAYRKKYRWKTAEAKCDTVNKQTGTYTCQVDAEAGGKNTQVTRNWNITVRYPPLPIRDSYYIPSGAEAGEIVTLTCDVCSYPEERSYKWKFNGEEVGKEREHFINGMTESKFGIYSCEVSNTINGEVRTAVLTYHVLARLPRGPSAVQDLNTTEVTSQTANVTFIPGFNGRLKQNFTVEYKLEADPDEKFQEVLKGIEDPNPTDPDEVSGPRIPVNARVGDLEAEQTYTFRVRSENDFHDENKRYSSWAYVNASTLVRPEVSLNSLVYTFPSEGKSEHIKFSWDIVKGQPESLTLKYRLDTVNTLADETEWMVMVEGVNPLDKEYSSETSENLDPKKDYVFILVTMEAKDLNGGASADFPVKGPDSPTNPGGLNVGAIAAGVIGVLVVGIAVGVILTVLFMKRRKTTKKEEHVSVNVDVSLQERSNPQSQRSHGLHQEPQLHHEPHPRKEQSPEPPSQQQEGEYELDEDQVKPQLHPKPNHDVGGYLYMAGHRSYYNKPTNNGTVSPYEEIGTKTLEGAPPNIYDRIATTNGNVDYENPQ